jgi:hypothetical protein
MLLFILFHSHPNDAGVSKGALHGFVKFSKDEGINGETVGKTIAENRF